MDVRALPGDNLLEQRVDKTTKVLSGACDDFRRSDCSTHDQNGCLDIAVAGIAPAQIDSVLVLNWLWGRERCGEIG